MPYIKKANRAWIDTEVAEPSDAGELNYFITKACLKFLKKTDERYSDYNTIVGVLESAKLEFYRRAVASYEDEKIKENGDLF